MTHIIYYFQPGACSRVSLNALEEAGVEFSARPLNLARGDQRSPEYLSVNPKGKVPTLIYEGRVITENPAIMFFLHQTFPEANLLPWAADDTKCIEGLSDLIWCSSSLHPMVRQMMKPSAFTLGEEFGVRDSGKQQFQAVCEGLEKRLAGQAWWYGDSWSIMDVYLGWLTETGRIAGFDLSPFSGIAALQQRVRSRPAFQRALDKEKQAVIDIGMQLPPGAQL